MAAESQVVLGDIKEEQGSLGATAAQSIKHAWKETSGAVSDAVDSVQTTAATAMEAVQDATQALGQALDLSEHVRRAPWLAVGGAVLVGFIIGATLNRARY